jgi:flagellar basal-body rod protein FlgB
VGINFLNNDATLNALERYLDLSTRRQNLTHSNLANIDTPGFRALDINPDEEIKSVLGQGSRLSMQAASARHFSPSTPRKANPNVFEVEGIPMRNDLNDVDLDKEMLKLQETTMKFSLFAQVLKSEFRILHYAITEGR